MENKLAQYEIYDLYIFDLDGNLITKLDTLKKFEVNYLYSMDTYRIVAHDALLDKSLLKYIGKENNKTEYEKIIGNTTSISIGKTKGKQFKLIAKSIVRDRDTGKDQPITLEFPLVEMVSQPSFLNNIGQVSDFDVVFEVISEEDEFFRIHI